MSQRLVSIAHFATYLGVTERTVRNYISAGHFPVYRRPNTRGVLIDIEQADAALAALPTTVVRPGFGSFGPKAQIIDLPPRAVVVSDDEDQA